MSATCRPAVEVMVRIADLAVVPAPGQLGTTGLGSCLAVLLHDAAAGVGGLAHVLLPAHGDVPPANPAKYISTAVPALLERMGALGATRPVARLVGGARMFGALLPGDAPSVGERNVVAARHALAAAGVAIVGEDVGGDYGRSVHLDVAEGTVRVRSFARGERWL
jgi:chemotaxis protein CheD